MDGLTGLLIIVVPYLIIAFAGPAVLKRFAPDGYISPLGRVLRDLVSIPYVSTLVPLAFGICVATTISLSLTELSPLAIFTGLLGFLLALAIAVAATQDAGQRRAFLKQMPFVSHELIALGRLSLFVRIALPVGAGVGMVLAARRLLS